MPRLAEQQSAPTVHVYHGICAWAEGQLEGEPACPAALLPRLSPLGRLPTSLHLIC